MSADKDHGLIERVGHGLEQGRAGRACRRARPQRLALGLAADAARPARPAHPAGHCARSRLDLAKADRRRLYPRRAGAARRRRRPTRSTGSASAPSRSATSSSAIRPIPTSPSRRAVIQTADQVERQRRGLSRRRPRRSAARAGCVGGKVSWGQIDKLLPPPSGKPFTLPDLTVDLKDTTIALATPYGPMGFAVEGRGNLSGGFKGKLAAAAPRPDARAPARSTSSAPSSTSASSRGGRRSRARSAPTSFACPASNLRLDRAADGNRFQLLRGVRQLRRRADG